MTSDDRTVIGVKARVPKGTRLNGIYEIDHLIAKGGMGEVYKGHAIETGDSVAIKMIRTDLAESADALGLFRKEAAALHNLHHEAIVRYFVFTIDPVLGNPYLAMDFVDGQSLGERIKEGPLSNDELDILRKRIAGGFQAAHELGIIHRDVSPDNIILPSGNISRAKIIDFGIARSTAAGSATIIGSGFAGKYKYASPEQLGMQGGDVNARSDIYSFGLVLAEAATGSALDMSGTQVEIIAKRQRVPDLTAVNARLRPLIEFNASATPGGPAGQHGRGCRVATCRARGSEEEIVGSPADRSGRCRARAWRRRIRLHERRFHRKAVNRDNRIAFEGGADASGTTRPTGRRSSPDSVVKPGTSRSLPFCPGAPAAVLANCRPACPSGVEPTGDAAGRSGSPAAGCRSTGNHTTEAVASRGSGNTASRGASGSIIPSARTTTFSSVIPPAVVPNPTPTQNNQAIAAVSPPVIPTPLPVAPAPAAISPPAAIPQPPMNAAQRYVADYDGGSCSSCSPSRLATARRSSKASALPPRLSWRSTTTSSPRTVSRPTSAFVRFRMRNARSSGFSPGSRTGSTGTSSCRSTASRSAAARRSAARSMALAVAISLCCSSQMMATFTT